MLSENEIISLSLLESQKLWVHLKTIGTGHKDFATAKALIEIIEGNTFTDANGKKIDWVEPKQGPATAVADITVDGKSVKKGETVNVYEWQFNALRRFFKPLEAAAKKSVLIVGALLLLGISAMAQNQAMVYGTGPGVYNVVSVAGLYGGTNNVVGTNSTYFVGVLTTNTIVSPNWSVVNGQATNSPTTNVVSIVTNVPGTVSLVNMDMADVVVAAQLSGAGTSAATFSFDTSDDNVLWNTNHYIVSMTMAGTQLLSTNLPLTLYPQGYLRLDTIAYPSTSVWLTNVSVTVAKKPARTGP